MTEKGKLVVSIISSFMVTAVCLFWALSGFMSVPLHEQIGNGEKVIAGPLLDRTVIEQSFEFPDDNMGETIVIGMLFGTYARINPGLFTIQLIQNEQIQTHTLDPIRLVDGEIVSFPFSDLVPGQATLRIECLGGAYDRCATLWCHQSADTPPMSINGVSTDQSVDLWISKKVSNRDYVVSRMGWGGLVFLSFVFSCMLSVLIYSGQRAILLSKINASDLPNARRVSGGTLLLWPLVISLFTATTVSLVLFTKYKPVETTFALGDTFSTELVPAPLPLYKGVEVLQEIKVTPGMAISSLGLGLKFGTYMRENSARISVSLRQGEHYQEHVFNSKELVDNAERIFSFSGFEVGQAFLKLSGLNGKGSNSPTVWLDPGNSMSRVLISGEEHPQQLVVFRYRIFKEIMDIRSIIRRFPMHWFITIGSTVFFSLTILYQRQPRFEESG
ncbi:MAG: hypothetical protein O3C43_12225 [Verrucomicrobia bacterium]|nr:hypothetical protein [Verrucomicrobiota bacterium]MDA1067259.1 hypothetical protein [Verrucomicrobiota bacterium]